jgi:hypothetical protein
MMAKTKISADEGRKIYASALQYQGYCHELFAKDTIGNDAVLLDEANIPGLVGGKFPTYDISSRTEITSVKTHKNPNCDLTRDEIRQYRYDFCTMLGIRRNFSDGMDPVGQDAGRIAAIRDMGIPVPDEIKEASQEEIADYLRLNSVLRIPDDHVESVRQELESDIRALPEKYCLPENPTEEQVQSVAGRIKGTGYSSGVISGKVEQVDVSPDEINERTRTADSSGRVLSDRKSQKNSSTTENVELDNQNLSPKESVGQEKKTEDQDENYYYAYSR